MITSATIPMANGQTVVPVGQGNAGMFQLAMFAAAYPGAGTVKVEAELFNAPGVWVLLANGAQAATGAVKIVDMGVISAFRVTQSGLTGIPDGGAFTFAMLSLPAIGFPQDVFKGLRALNVQSYIESNVKLGQQFYVQLALPTILAAGTYNIHFRTGAKIALVKARDFYGYGNSIAYQIFRRSNNAGITGGSDITVHNYNDINPGVATCTVKGGVAVADVDRGIAWGDPQHLYGANTAGNRIGSGLAPGGDRILQPNTSYLIQIKNNDSGASPGSDAKGDWSLSWYEGNPDLPIGAY